MPNKLINETSPYLLQHANNPVNWYAWGNEALQKALDENKPILLSIGYSACHWCHVMEHESFEDEETAAIMNQHFINIKVDREERPDLDHIYMDAVQAMTGSGGWPLNIFLTPDKKPFYGGTYFPPVKMYNRNSWKDVLTGISKAFKERRNEIEEQAENITAHLQLSNFIGTKKNEDENFLTKETLQNIADKILVNADMEWGGFGNAPKFPQTMAISFLLKHFHFTKHQPSLDIAVLSLDKMYMGGLYDHAGGGFARYSTDAKWQVPHFEKMLYDNALLLGVYAEAYQLTHKKEYAIVISQTIAFLMREMQHEDGVFYAALDADSEGVEGKFYVWDKNEIAALLGNDADVFCKIFDIKEHGNWEHTNVLWMPENIDAVATKINITKDALQNKMDTCLKILLQKRNERIRPGLDDKILLGWNALLITAICKCYAALGDKLYLSLAQNIILFIENNLQNEDGSFAHSYKLQRSIQRAFLDDYASLAEAYLHLQQVTGNHEYFSKAKSLASFVIKNFDDESSPLFYFTEKGQDDVIVRKKELYDGATPSGNAQMAYVLNCLSIIFEIPSWKRVSQNILISLRGVIEQYPASFCFYANELYSNVYGINEIGICGEYYSKFLNQVLHNFIPFKIIQSTVNMQKIVPSINFKNDTRDSFYYLCKNYTCYPPVDNINDLLNIINKQ